MEKKIEYIENSKSLSPPLWANGTLLGFGIDYEFSDGVAGHTTMGIVLKENGDLDLMPLKFIRCK